jgi:hypothetical protein
MSKARNIADSFSSTANRGAYVTIQTNGSTLTSRPTLNITNAIITDDSANARTNVIIGGVQDVLDGGSADGIATYDGGDPTSSSYTYNINGGTP